MTSLNPAYGAPVLENGLQEAQNQKVIEMTVPILSGCLDFGGRSAAMLTKNGINSPKGYITNDDKPWPWKFHYLSTHEKMKSKMGLWVHLGKI